RKLEEDYIDFATKIERESSLSDMTEPGTAVCPVCNKSQLILNRDGTGSSMTVCVDCEKRTCADCGEYQTSLQTKV
ncbi:unnamed protein product, partial [Lymnaea stagnalis]